MGSILQSVELDIPAPGCDRFVVSERFRVGEANINYISEGFSVLFSHVVESKVPMAKLTSYKLEQDSLDGPIKAKLGWSHEVYLFWIFHLMENQVMGGQHRLVQSGKCANLFYCYDRVASVRWSDSDLGWDLFAHQLDDGPPWLASYRVFAQSLFF
jgi:hypothetical protein